MFNGVYLPEWKFAMPSNSSKADRDKVHALFEIYNGRNSKEHTCTVLFGKEYRRKPKAKRYMCGMNIENRDGVISEGEFDSDDQNDDNFLPEIKGARIFAPRYWGMTTEEALDFEREELSKSTNVCDYAEPESSHTDENLSGIDSVASNDSSPIRPKRRSGKRPAGALIDDFARVRIDPSTGDSDGPAT